MQIASQARIIFPLSFTKKTVIPDVVINHNHAQNKTAFHPHRAR